MDTLLTSILTCLYTCSIALTKLDVLDCLQEIKIAIGYLKGGKRLDYFPGKSYATLSKVFR